MVMIWNLSVKCGAFHEKLGTGVPVNATLPHIVILVIPYAVSLSANVRILWQPDTISITLLILLQQLVRFSVRLINHP